MGLLLRVHRKWGICCRPRQQEGVRAGPKPGRHTFSLPVLRGSLGGSGGREGRGRERRASAFLGCFGSWPLLGRLDRSDSGAWPDQGGTFFRAG